MGSYFLGLVSCVSRPSSSKVLMASDLEFIRFSKRKSSSRSSNFLSATKMTLGFSVGILDRYHLRKRNAKKYVNSISNIIYMGYTLRRAITQGNENEISEQSA